MQDDDRDALHWSAVEEAAELIEERDFGRALEQLRDVLRRDQQNPYAFFYVGQAMSALGELEPARDAYRAAVKEQPNYLGARVALSNVLRKLGSLDEALREAKEALERFPQDGDAHAAAGMVLAAAGLRDRARFHLERFLASKPSLEAGHEARGVLAMLQEGDDDEPFELA